MVELSLRDSSESVQIKEIAAAHAIPQHYLEQLLVTLKRAGLVRSYRGAHGGYALAKHPKEIRIIDIFESLEGKLAVLRTSHSSTMLSFFFADLEQSIAASLDITLEEMLLRKQENDNRFIYTI